MFHQTILKQARILARSKCRSFPELSSVRRVAPTSLRFSTLTPEEEKFYKEGILDERGLVQFDTLHNMQVRSCRVYAEKNLFATYSPETQKFEWMTFAECTLKSHSYFYCLFDCQY
jgi:hypothetical protein